MIALKFWLLVFVVTLLGARFEERDGQWFIVKGYRE